MIKYLALLLFLLVNSNLYSSDVQVIELHENITLDQMVLDQLSDETESEDEINEINEIIEDKDENDVKETEIEFTKNLISQNDSSFVNTILNNSKNIKSKLLQSELNFLLLNLKLDYENKNNREIFLLLVNYFYEIGDISKVYNLIKSRDISEDENLNFYNFLEMNYLLSTSQLENVCNFKNFLSPDLNSKSSFVDKIEIFCLILENKLSEADLLNSILIETEENFDNNFQQLISFLTNDEDDYNSLNKFVLKNIDPDLIFLYSAMARIAELPLNEQFLEVDPLNLAIPIILNKSTPDSLRLKAANHSFNNENISVESLAALYQSLDFNAQQLNSSEEIILELESNVELLMAYYFQYINIQIFPSERLDAIIKFWNYAKSKNLEYIAYSLTYKIIDSIEILPEYLEYSPQIAISYIYNRDLDKALKWIDFYEKSIGIDNKIAYVRVLLNLYSAEKVSSVIEIISNNFKTFSNLNNYEAEELIYTIFNSLENEHNQTLRNDFENIFDDRQMPSIFITENIINAIEIQNENEFLIYSIISINNKQWKEIHPNHLKILIEGYFYYKDGEIIKDLILEIFENYKII